MQEKEFYTTAEVAERLNVKERHVKERVRLGELRVTRLGRLWRFHRDDIETYIEASRKPGQPS